LGHPVCSGQFKRTLTNIGSGGGRGGSYEDLFAGSDVVLLKTVSSLVIQTGSVLTGSICALGGLVGSELVLETAALSSRDGADDEFICPEILAMLFPMLEQLTF